jgi:hypothetical protein
LQAHAHTNSKGVLFCDTFKFFLFDSISYVISADLFPGKPALRTQDVSQNHFLFIVATHWMIENGPREWGAESPSSQPWRTGFSELRNVLYTGGTCSIVLAPYATIQSFAAPIIE